MIRLTMMVMIFRMFKTKENCQTSAFVCLHFACLLLAFVCLLYKLHELCVTSDCIDAVLCHCKKTKDINGYRQKVEYGNVTYGAPALELTNQRVV